MAERPTLPPTPPTAPVKINPIFQLAYGNIGAGPSSNVYRIERGYPFQRRGVPVTIASQFNALGGKTGSAVGLHSPVNENAITSGQLDPSKPGFLQNGSNVPTFITVAFTFNATSTTALTISWPATPIRRANRQPALNLSFDTAIPTGSISITGLTAATQYFWYPFWSEAGKVLGWAGAGNATSAGSPAISQTAQSDLVLQSAQFQGFVPLNTLTFTMPAAGTSTVTGGYASGAAGLNITGGGRQYRIF
ncbi:MAG TPA: hypothetical protein VF748_16075 [Candidatus Acidoferrum sp.]